MQRGYLDISRGVYVATTVGLEFAALDEAESVRDKKRCPGCKQTLPSGRFWVARSQSDGLFPYCIECGKLHRQRKRLEMEQDKQAVAEIVAAGRRIAEAARLWDTGVVALAQAWSEIVKGNEAMRVNRQILKIEQDNGRMEARLIHPRAAFSLGVALSDVGYPIGYGVLREAGMPLKLAAYVGDAPHEDYVGKTEEEPSDGRQAKAKTAKRRKGTKNRRSKQAHQRAAPDGAGGAG